MSRSRNKARRLFKARCRPTARPLAVPALGLFDRAMAAVEKEDAVIDFLVKPGPCALCGRQTSWLATRVANPPEAQLLGAAPGKSRVITSHLCDRCNDGNGVARLELEMWRDLGGSESIGADR
jgi:hypothetical protein